MNLSLESELSVGDLAAGPVQGLGWPSGLRQPEEHDVYRLMAESVESVAFFLLSPEGRVASWNPGATRIEGYQPEEIMGQHLSIFYPPEARAGGLPEQELATAHSMGRCESEGWRVRKDGSRLLANVSIAALRDKGGTLLGYSNVTRDLTETRAAEEKVRRAYSQLNAVMDSSSDGIMQISHDWTILYGNRKAAERLLDFKVGGHLWECFPALLGTHVERTLRRAMRDRVNTVYDNHYAPYNMWYRSRAFPTEDGISIFFTDITSQKTLEEQLALEQILREKRMEALSNLAGGLAHEINNPLAIVHARASDLCNALVGDAPVPAEDVRVACGSIVHASDRAIRVLRALQGFARDAGSDPMQLTPPAEVLERCVDMLERSLPTPRGCAAGGRCAGTSGGALPGDPDPADCDQPDEQRNGCGAAVRRGGPVGVFERETIQWGAGDSGGGQRARN